VFTRNAVLTLCSSALREGTPSCGRWNSAPGLFVLLRFCSALDSLVKRRRLGKRTDRHQERDFKERWQKRDRDPMAEDSPIGCREEKEEEEEEEEEVGVCCCWVDRGKGGNGE
jgi:hypothetical protein